MANTYVTDLTKETGMGSGSGDALRGVTLPLKGQMGQCHGFSGPRIAGEVGDPYECPDCAGEKSAEAAHCFRCAGKHRRKRPNATKRRTTLYMRSEDLDKLAEIGLRLKASQSEVVATLVRIAHRDFERMGLGR